jgi:hypothetical protein
MKQIILLHAALALSCAVGDHRKVQVRTLSSGRVVEVTVPLAIAGPPESPYLWFEYQTQAAVPGPLLAEIREVWSDLRPEAAAAGVPTVFVEAISMRRSIRWEGAIIERIAREKGCVSYTRLPNGEWRESELSCCLMAPCEARSN